MDFTKNEVDIQGHRGCRGLMPENTLEAFKKAIEIGVHTLELDVAVSKDHVVVVSHEPYMNSAICLDKNGEEIPLNKAKNYKLYAMNYAEIKKFDCGTKINSRFPKQKKIKTFKPALAHVFQEADALNANIKYNIEIKAKPEYDGVFTPKPEVFVALV
ncbi:MAG: glycerophosphodiester phosphodiesterase family protein, partial [Oceanihabitans sp.]